MNNIYQILKERFTKFADFTALLAPGNKSMSYSELLLSIDETIDSLHRLGFLHTERIAIALPDSPEMQIMTLAVVSCAVCAPLNPRLAIEEMVSSLQELKAKAIVCMPCEKIKEAAARLNIKVLEISPWDKNSRNMLQVDSSFPLPAYYSFPEPDDIAFLLHTSGTTQKTKIVRLSQRSLCAAANYASKELDIVPGDRYLHVLPSFHLYGMAQTLWALLSGITVISTPGFSIDDFFLWLKEFKPTWYSAVPAMHQKIVEKIKESPNILPRHCLRYIRSASAPLSDTLRKELERVFQVPVLNTYGMTEVIMSIASDPLPPLIRKSGSVGRVLKGIEVQAMDADRQLLPKGQNGEIVLRGERLMDGYEGEQGLDTGKIFQGWFYTGDLGYVDEENYLYLNGRSKETINCGGEKISPYEIEEALQKHPSIAQAVVFATPHSDLGEQVAAAVVLYSGAKAGSKEILEFLLLHLSPTKLPRRIWITSSIPAMENGKIQRQNLWKHFKDQDQKPYIAPRNQQEQEMLLIWSNSFPDKKIGMEDSFFDLGGDSLAATRIISHLKAQFQVEVPLPVFFTHPTISQLCEYILNEKDRKRRKEASNNSFVTFHVVELQKGTTVPLFCTPHVTGNVASYQHMVKFIPKNQTVYGLMFECFWQNFHQLSMTLVCENFAKNILSKQPEGPYYIGGNCLGGIFAFETARLLYEMGKEVKLLFILDIDIKENTFAFLKAEKDAIPQEKKRYRNFFVCLFALKNMIQGYTRRISHAWKTITWKEIFLYFYKKFQDFPALLYRQKMLFASNLVRNHNKYLYKDYRVKQPYPGKILLILSKEGSLKKIKKSKNFNWNKIALGGVEILEIPGKHAEFIRSEIVSEALGKVLTPFLPCSEIRV